MIRSYDEAYLEVARISLGTMLDFAVNQMGQDLERFWQAFLDSGLSDRFGRGDYQIIAGRSGVELAYNVRELSGEDPSQLISYEPSLDRSPEYWLGWALAYYQWVTVMSFREITDTVSIGRILDLYNPYHEMDILQFCDRMDQLCGREEVSRLQLRRNMADLSQSELSALARVPLRTLQKYERKERDLSMASFETVYRLAQVLCCDPLDLVERTQ